MDLDKIVSELTADIISEDAAECAKNCWWQAHDSGDFESAVKQFVRQEEIIAKYAGNKPNLEETAKHFESALKFYDKFADAIKRSESASITQLRKDRVLDSIELVYESLGTQNPKSVARNVAGWWTNYINTMYSQMKFEAKKLWVEKEHDVDYNSLKGCTSQMFEHIVYEHRERFGLDENMSRGLACLIASAAYLGHNKRDWKLNEMVLKSYYTELFTALTKK